MNQNESRDYEQKPSRTGRYPEEDRASEPDDSASKGGEAGGEESSTWSNLKKLSLLALITGLVLAGAKMIGPRTPYTPRPPHFGENDRKLLELARVIADIYKKT